MNSPKFASVEKTSAIFGEMMKAIASDEVAIVRNPSYIYAPLEFYPLAPKIRRPLQRLAGVVKDMDGTTTTTEPLCLHSLEWMVRQISGRLDKAHWAGLDHARDYPHIIGNSTTKHVEYLLTTYAADIQPSEFLKAYITAAIWTLVHGRDEGRRREVKSNIPALGLAMLLENSEFQKLSAAAHYDETAVPAFSARIAPAMLASFRIDALTDRVRAAVDVYYMRYHVILADIADGKGAARAREVLGSATAHLIEPMPGIGPFLAAAKGWLGADLEHFFEPLASHVMDKNPSIPVEVVESGKARLGKLGAYLQRNPIPLAVVTSSIAYEARIVLGQVFDVLRQQIAAWPVSQEVKDRILPRFASPDDLYDAIITASDSSEIRLKPHRDLYSIALHAIGLAREDYASVIGFEDSESGVIAIRAAGIGLSVAVPFADTAGHDLSAAAQILPAQIPEALLVRNLFLAEEMMAE